MTFAIRGFRVLLSAALLAAASGSLHAQEPNRRPFRRIFGGERERPGPVNRLDLRLSGGMTYDDHFLPETIASEEAEGGIYPTGSMSLSYRRGSGTAMFDATAASSFQYYSQRDEPLDQSHSGGINLHMPVGRRGTVRVAQTASYATFSTLLGLPGSAIADPGVSLPGGELLQAGESYGVSDDGGWQFNTHAALGRELGRNGSLEGRYRFTRTDLSDIRTSVNEAGLHYSYTLTPQAALVAGYSYQRGRSAAATEDIVFHDIDLGVSYSRRLPGLRNTSLSLATGSAILQTATGREVSLLGDARLVHLMGRTWTAALGYHRGFEFVDVLAQVVSADSVTATLNGLLNARLETWVSSSYSRGNLGTGAGSALTSFAGIVRGQYALSQRLALDAQYIHYFHEFGTGAELPGSLASDLTRSAVRLGLTVLLPVVR